MNWLDWLAARLQEASSYAGIATTLLGLLHVSNAADVVNQAIGILVALGGLIAFIRKEGQAPAPAPVPVNPPAPPARPGV